MAEFPQLASDGRNWTEYREKLEDMLTGRKLAQYITGTETTQRDSEFWRAQNNLAKPREGYETLKRLFEKTTTTPTATTRVLDDIRNNRTARDTAYSPETTNDRVCRRSHVTDMSRRDDDVSDGSSRRVHDIPSSLTRHQHQREMKGQGRVEGREEVGRKWRKSNGEADEKVTAVTGPGNGAMDHKTGGVSLVKPTSRENDSLKTHVDTPNPPPPPPTSPTMPVEQPASTSRRLSRQRGRNGHVPRNGTRQTREDGEGSWGRVESSSRGSRADDEDGDDDDVQHGHVEPQEPQTTCQTAINEAADTSNPNATSAGTTMPVGTSNGPPNRSNEAEGKGGKGEGNERASGDVAPSSNGENTVPDLIPPAPNPDERRESNGENAVPDLIPPAPNPDKRGPPLSMPLEGEKGQQSSGHADEAATHLEQPASGDIAPSSNGENAVPDSTPPPPYPDELTTPPPSTPLEGENEGKQSSRRPEETATHLETPRHELRTTPPERTPYDHRLNGEGRRMAIGHRQAVGEEDEVGGGNDGRETSYRVNEWQVEGSRDDEERQETRGNEGERSRTREYEQAASTVEERRQHTTKDDDDSPAPPIPTPPPPSPDDPER
ncbi:hypothetical protein BDN67DRAFT_1017907 [Paxillus ammoniavirescens]|nr:hypothetical protein BDN67DRAFT_1017907 [Paxillus ammoniavirescens]